MQVEHRLYDAHLVSGHKRRSDGGDDNEATVGGSHPTDLGFVRIAGVFEKALTPLLER